MNSLFFYRTCKSVEIYQKYLYHNKHTIQLPILNTCGVRSGATSKTRHVILDFDIVSEIITFEQKGRFGKEKHQNLGVKVKVIA